MTIDQAIEALQAEKLNKIASRFPCRAVMVQNIIQYCELLDKLHQLPDIEFVPSSDLFSGADVMPRYEILTSPQYADRWLVLTGVSEYLRLFNRNEAESQRFAKLWSNQTRADNMGRIIIPLWGCEAQWHDNALHLAGDIRQQDYYYRCMDTDESNQHMKVIVLSDAFEKYYARLEAQHGQLLFGLRDWYDYWAKPTPDNAEQVLMTGRYRSVQPVTGNITVHVIQDTLSFVRENLKNGDQLTRDNCPEEAQACLFDAALAGNDLDSAILSCLNVAAFSGLDIMGKWNTLSAGEKQLVTLWLRLHPDESYLCHCFSGAKSLANVDHRVLSEVFVSRNTHPAWVRESQQLIAAMGLIRDQEYFHQVDQIPEYAERLAFLTGRTTQERVYLLHMVGVWLREDPVQVHQCEVLQRIYTELFAYLDSSPYDEDLSRYMGLYKSYKLANTLPEDEDIYFSNFSTEAYDLRHPALANAIDQQTVVLWIDALGVEWMPLLLWSLKQCDEGNVIQYSVAQANLPTETEYNHQWDKMTVAHDKLDRLDKLAHKGVIDDPDYYACVEEQITFVVDGIRKKVHELLSQYHRVIITGDHGTSRLAARFFHKRAGFPLGKNGKVCSHGRYALLSGDGYVKQPAQMFINGEDDEKFVIFTNYDHFSQPGFAAGVDDENAVYGEVHGGATPEEMLVPVIVFDSKEALPLLASWQTNPVKVSMKKVKAVLQFNQPVVNLQASIHTVAAECTVSGNGMNWMLTFPKMDKGAYSVAVVADGKLIPVEALNVLPAIESGDGDFDL